MTNADVLRLRGLEEGLWRTETRFDPVWMAQILAPDFMEYGCSGRIYARDEILPGEEERGVIDATLPLPGFAVRALSSEIVQVTYVSALRSRGAIQLCNRSSIWRRVGASWQLCFH